MLTKLRESSTGSLVIFVLFGMLIFVFIFFFGPQSQGFQPGSGTGTPNGTAATVNGQTVPAKHVEAELRKQFGYGSNVEKSDLARFRRLLAEQVVDQVLVEQKARAAGIAVSEDELSRYIIGKENSDARFFVDQNGNFSSQRYQDQVTQGFGATTEDYRAMKEREFLVKRYLRFLTLQVEVGEPAVREAFERSKRTWDLAFLVADPALYADQAAKPDAAAGAAYAKANADAVKAWYDDHKNAYDRDKEVRIRRILIKPGKGIDDAAQAKELATAKTKAAELLAKVNAPGADFAAIATESSQGFYKSQGGDMGWQKKQTTSAADYEFYSKLAKGQVSAVRESPVGLSIIKVDDVRPEVRKTLAEVTNEIGLKLATIEASKKIARAKAQSWLVQAKAGKTLEQIAEAANPAPPKAPPKVVEDIEDGEAPTDGEPVVDVPEPAVTPVAEGPKVEVITTGNFGNNRPAWAVIPTIGKSPELAKALNGLTAEKPLFDKLVEVDDRFYVVRLAKRVEPDEAEYKKEKKRIALELRAQRTNALFGNWQAVVLGPIQQREMAQRMGGANAFAALVREGANIRINEEIYPEVKDGVPVIPVRAN